MPAHAKLFQKFFHKLCSVKANKWVFVLKVLFPGMWATNLLYYKQTSFPKVLVSNITLLFSEEKQRCPMPLVLLLYIFPTTHSYCYKVFGKCNSVSSVSS